MDLDDVLATFASDLDELEGRLSSGEWAEVGTAPTPPVLGASPTSGQRERARELLVRWERCRGRLVAHLERTRADLEDLAARRTAARAYAWEGTGAVDER